MDFMHVNAHTDFLNLNNVFDWFVLVSKLTLVRQATDETQILNDLEKPNYEVQMQISFTWIVKVIYLIGYLFSKQINIRN